MAFMAIVLTGCNSGKQAYAEVIGVLDYSEFSSNGFFVTESNSVNFDYTPLGSLSIQVFPGEGDEWYFDNGVARRKGDSSTAPASALRVAVREARRLNANAIINLSVKPIQVMERSGILVTGMAVKK